MSLNVLECPTAASARVYPLWWRRDEGVLVTVRVGVDGIGRPYVGDAINPRPVIDDGKWRGPCLALPQYADLTNPWRPGAHAEERVMAGGKQQVVTSERSPSVDDFRVDGYRPAHGGAGIWCYVGTCEHGPLWLRWIVP